MDQTLPDGIDERHCQPPGGLAAADWLPVAVLGAIVALALSGALGGDSGEPSLASAPAVEASFTAPPILRSGMLFEASVEVEARRDIADLTLAIPDALWRHTAIDATIPAATSEKSEGEAYLFSFGPLAAGETMRVKIDGQLQPEARGTRRGRVELRDGDAVLAAMPVTMRVLP